uniref:Uncharacterized protein n=1 Tax=Anguilla anguilla TaxID=7936 RepID=A0A0E9WD30_ANGAN
MARWRRLSSAACQIQQ